MTVYGGLSLFIVLFTIGIIWEKVKRTRNKEESNVNEKSNETSGDVPRMEQLRGKINSLLGI